MKNTPFHDKQADEDSRRLDLLADFWARQAIERRRAAATDIQTARRYEARSATLAWRARNSAAIASFETNA